MAERVCGQLSLADGLVAAVCDGVPDRIAAVTEPARLRDILARTVSTYERERAEKGAEPWRSDRLPEDYVAGAAKGVVGFELTIDRLEGRFKLSRNLDAADQRGAIVGLRGTGAAVDLALPAAMAEACGILIGGEVRPRPETNRR